MTVNDKSTVFCPQIMAAGFILYYMYELSLDIVTDLKKVIFKKLQ